MDADRMRECLPAYGRHLEGSDPAEASGRTQAAAGKIVSTVRSAAIAQRRNVIEEGTFRDTVRAAGYVRALHGEGYRIELRVLAVPFEESNLGTYQRYESQRHAGIDAARFVDDDYQEQAYDNLRQTVAQIERLVDRLTVHTRDGQLVHDTQHECERNAVDALDEYRQIRSSAQRSSLAQGWEEVATLAASREAATDWRARIDEHLIAAHLATQADRKVNDHY